MGNSVYTQAQSPSGQYVVSLDVETGVEKWRRRYEPAWEPNGEWPGPYATPTYSRGRVCFAGCEGTVGCLDAEDGELLWHRAAKQEFGGVGTSFGFAASPLIVGDTVIVPVGGESASVVAFDLESGSVRWSTGSDAAGYTPSYPIIIQGRLQVVSSLASVVVAHDPDNGDELWRYDLRKQYNPHPGWPLYEEPYLLVPLAFRRGSHLLKLSSTGDSAGVEKVWESETLSNDLFSSVTVDGFVYGFDIHDPQTSMDGVTKGEFKCIELLTGLERWSTGSFGGASVVSDGKRLILFTERSELVIAEARPDEYREIGRWPVFPGKISWTPPLVIGEKVLLRGGNRVAMLQLGASSPELAAVPLTTDGLVLTPGEIPAAWVDQLRGQRYRFPGRAEFAVWFAWCFAILGVSWLLAWPAFRSSRIWAVLLLAESSLLGLAAFPLLSEWLRWPVFTWPAVLFALFVGLMRYGTYAEQAGSRRAAWWVRLMTLLFCAACIVYDLACRKLGLPAGRGFLVGFLAAWPLVRLGNDALVKDRRMRGLVMLALGFTAYFWMSVLFYFWRVGGS